MWQKITDMFTALRNALTGPSRSRVSARLGTAIDSHQPGEVTNLIASLSTLATNTLHTLTVRTRRVRAKLRRNVVSSADQLAGTILALQRFDADLDVVANAEQAKTARTYVTSGKKHFLDVRVSRAIVWIIAVIVAIADFGFMFAVYRDLFVLSVATFAMAQLGEWAVALTLPMLFPAVVIALAEFGGKSLGRVRAHRMHPERAEQIFGVKITDYAKSWAGWPMGIVYVLAALLIGAFFFVMAIHRFGTAASDAGLSFPTWALAVGYGVLPIVALLIDAASRDVVLEHDRKTLTIFTRNQKRHDELERGVLQARSGLTSAWLALKWRVVRILQDANQSIVLFEQLLTDGYARSNAIGAIAPLVSATRPGTPGTVESATRTADPNLEFAVPSLTQHRSLTTPIMRWLTTELEVDIEILRIHNPHGDASKTAVARAVKAGEPGMGRPEAQDLDAGEASSAEFDDAGDAWAAEDLDVSEASAAEFDDAKVVGAHTPDAESLASIGAR